MRSKFFFLYFRRDRRVRAVIYARYIFRFSAGLLNHPYFKTASHSNANPQNCVAHFDLDSHELKGFIVRDMEGLLVHPGTLTETTRSGTRT